MIDLYEKIIKLYTLCFYHKMMYFLTQSYYAKKERAKHTLYSQALLFFLNSEGVILYF